MEKSCIHLVLPIMNTLKNNAKSLSLEKLYITSYI